MSILLLDTSNMLYRTFFANKEQQIDSDLALHMAFLTMNKFYKKFRPTTTVLAFDKRGTWRKKYTTSEECYSTKPYKGDRRKNMTPMQRKKFNEFIEHINEFEDIMRTNTSVVCASCEGLEADDIIAGFVQAYGEIDGGEDITIVSRDRDLAQLQGKGRNVFYQNVTQYDPFNDKNITLETATRDLLNLKKKVVLEPKYINNEYFLYAKCIRGDKGDFVQSAFPGVRRTRINKSFDDSYEKTNLLNETWECGIREKTFQVGKLMEENNLLMNLRAQPKHIRTKIFTTIMNEMDNPGTFNYFTFLKFLGDHDLKRISKQLENFIPLLDS